MSSLNEVSFKRVFTKVISGIFAESLKISDVVTLAYLKNNNSILNSSFSWTSEFRYKVNDINTKILNNFIK